jgi:hypothetical protein
MQACAMSCYARPPLTDFAFVILRIHTNSPCVEFGDDVGLQLGHPGPSEF